MRNKNIKYSLMKNTIFVLAISMFVIACSNEQKMQSINVTAFVNPFIGTSAHGHTFPGATVPFGMVQLSPDTYNSGWDWCAGYHYSDNSIMGFSHTHLSGTGRGELLDILMMPTTGAIQFNAGTRENPDTGYRSRFSHDNEEASPGYYSVLLDDYQIKAELTATQRAGFHRYTFENGKKGNLLIDMAHSLTSDSISEGYLKVLNDSVIVGSHKSKGWGVRDEKYWVEHEVFFAAKLSAPIVDVALFNDGKILTNVYETKGKVVKGNFIFDIPENEELLVKVGISGVNLEGALANLDAEINGWDFNKVKTEASNNWAEMLNKFQIEDDNRANKETFYTSVYHACIAPFTASDVDGKYMGFDKKVKQAKGFTMCTGLSLWDTFRAANPLYTFVSPTKVSDIINSMLVQYEQYGLLPVWSLCNSETNCMIGYHSIPIIVDAYLKGIGGFDAEKAFEAMKKSAMQDDFDIQYLKEYNYIPRDLAHTESVARTLEYAFDDYCIALMAQKMGKTEDFEYFSKRGQAFQNLFDKSIGFMRGKDSHGKFRSDFDPYNAVNANSDFIEGNSWQYTWYVPHDVQSLIDGMGGNSNFIARLDTLFSVSSKLDEDTPLDVSGLIGQYAHGNEPSHHIVYLYTLAGAPEKTQEIVHQICNQFYSNQPDGLCGNEDMGQMSAWYIFSSLGFYPVNPAIGEYVIGTPAFKQVKMILPNGKTFTVEAKNLSDENFYVQSVSLNGNEIENGIINHQQILDGGELVFQMTDKKL